MKNSLTYAIVSCVIFLVIGCQSGSTQESPWTKATLLFEDNGTENWQQKWMLDGLQSQVINSKEGMELIAGLEHGNDSSHTVLWTKQAFEGNISIEYDYTRTDTATRCVNILYFHAEGKGGTDHPKDISLWNDKRKIPSMRTYFDNMNTYHISYAAFAANEYSGENDYIRLRRYNPNKDGLKGTDVPDDYFNTGLFKPGVTYHVEIIKYNNIIEMHVQNKKDTSDYSVCKWDASLFPLYDSGRIGLRHMYTRSARYKNFKVWKLN
ncbi:DUF1961 family protein [uncultured Cyclobacterium sp.]|uniref:DUF1961 family protein n=1 Tax=uncultured Cyclobacterium sp. TaxID=453820 RepID=UPI0030EDC724|tara:strand:+ start:14381 stop:15175 length:795 start_codon:yes stop_codon:yes gene_type:complete